MSTPRWTHLAVAAGLVGLGALLRPPRREVVPLDPGLLGRQDVTGFGSGTLAWTTAQGSRREAPVLVACTDDQIAQGLAGRRDLAGHDGMLLWLPVADEVALHMVNTPLPLDAVFFDDQGRWAAQLALAPGGPDDTREYHPGVPWRWCVEVPRGRSAAMGLTVGCRLDLDGLLGADG